jgi:hypothetical protein
MLLRHMTLEGPVLEPSAGCGAIVESCAGTGYRYCLRLYDHQAKRTRDRDR